MKYAPVGSVVQDGYWREKYTVVSHNQDGTVTVRWHGDESASEPRTQPRAPLGVLPASRDTFWPRTKPRVTTHRTPFDPKHDRIVS